MLVRWQAHVSAIKLSEDDQVLEVLKDIKSKSLEFISEVEEKNDKLWIGSIMSSGEVDFWSEHWWSENVLVIDWCDCGRVLVVCGRSHWWCAARDIDGVWSELLVVCGLWTEHTGGVWSERRCVVEN
ncbi:Protein STRICTOSIDINE SYNTHASE-LIKE 3 [Capsicum chinense]|nr:Protein STRICTOSIDINE SYNTHASE-LIKE 3 [Capsicum chinense]